MSKSVHIEGRAHVNPIPAAARVGNLVASSVISPIDATTGSIPPSLDEQCALLFAAIRTIIEAAGGTVEDIVKLTVYLDDPGTRSVVNRHWLELFPDEDARPARQTIQRTHAAPTLVSCDFLANLDPGREP